MRKRQITKEDLQRLGITNVTEDGRVFKGNVELSYHKRWCKHKYGTDKFYLAINIYDPLIHKEQVDNNKRTRNGIRGILLHRLVYAWFYGQTSDDPSMDVCHKDDDPLNNHYTNLVEKPHIENLYERKIKTGGRPKRETFGS